MPCSSFCGGVKVLNRDADGREVILSILGAGECFGEMGLIDDAPRSADVVTTEPCDLLMISKADFTRALAENVDLCLNIMKSLVMRLREANHKIESLALMDVYGRVAKLLLDFREGGWQAGSQAADHQAGYGQDGGGLRRDGQPGDARSRTARHHQQPLGMHRPQKKFEQGRRGACRAVPACLFPRIS